MVSGFVYRDHSRYDGYALYSNTRISCVDATSKIIKCLLVQISGVMKWRSTGENCGLLGAKVIDLNELPRPHPTKRIWGICTRFALLHGYTYGNLLTLFS